MNENIKSIVSGAVGIVIGVLLTVFGVSELNKHVVKTAVEIGKTQNESEARAEDVKKIEQDIKALQEEATTSLDNLEQQKARLQQAQDEINILLEEVTKTKGPEAKEKLEALQLLVAGLENSTALQRLMEIEIAVASLTSMVQSRTAPNLKWPHAINCGESWDAFFFLHASPIKLTDDAWYVQVFPSEYRYVRFNGDTTFHDSAGHQPSRAGCDGKPIAQLKEEGRTFQLTPSN